MATASSSSIRCNDQGRCDDQDRSGWSQLHSAAAKGHTQCVKLLLQRGGKNLVHISTTGADFTCLHLAAFFGHIEIVNLHLHSNLPSIPFLSSMDRWKLMDRQSSLESFTALHMAVIGSHGQGETIAESILKAYRTSVLDNYDLESNPKREYSIDDELWLDYLFHIRNYLNLQDGDDFSPWQRATVPSRAYNVISSRDSGDNGAAKCVTHLNSSGPILSFSDTGDRRAASDPPWIIYSRQAMLENLASYGNRRGSVLRKKLLGKYEGLVRSYVELVSYSNDRDKIGRTALHYAAWENKVEVVKFLTWDTRLQGPNPHDSQLGSVANVNTTDINGYTPLHMAAWKGSTDVAKVLLGDDVVAKDIKLSPRQNWLVKKMRLQPNAAARSTDRSQSIAKVIQDALHTLGNGAQPLLNRDPFCLQDTVWDEKRAGVTPLHYAIEKAHTEIVELLVEHPYIDVFQCNSDGQSPWMIVFPPRLKLDKTPSENEPPRIASTSSAIQRLLRSGSKEPSWTKGKFEKHQLYRQRLLKKAATLAGEVDEEDPNIDAAFQFLELETQIFVTFLENTTGTMGPYEKPPSTTDKRLKLIGHLKKKKSARDSKSSVWEDEIESYLCSSDMERISLLHVAAFEGCGQELQKLLELKRFKDCINDRENITCFGSTALHFAIMNCKTDTHTLAVLLNEKTLNPTMRNKRGETPLYIMDHKLQYDRSSPTLLDTLKLLMGLYSTILPFDQYCGIDARELLMKHPEVNQFVEDLYKERTIHANSASALLVGAALLANISYSGWLKPPQKNPVEALPPATLNNFFFWNACSFVLALTVTVIGAAAVLRSTGLFIEKDLVLVRILFRFGSVCLVSSICFFICTIIIISPSLLEFSPDDNKVSLEVTVTLGSLMVISALGVFVTRLARSAVHIRGIYKLTMVWFFMGATWLFGISGIVIALVYNW